MIQVKLTSFFSTIGNLPVVLIGSSIFRLNMRGHRWARHLCLSVAFIIIFPTTFLSTDAFGQTGEDINAVGLLAGEEFGSEMKFAEDIARLTRVEGLTLNVKTSEGSLDNIQRMASRENAALGIVQSDILSLLANSPDAKLQKISQNLRAVFPLSRREVHIFARKNVTSVSDLSGKRVIVGQAGGDEEIAANNILRVTGVVPSEKISLAAVAALREVLANKADAAFIVGSMPVKLMSMLQDLPDSEEYKAGMEQVHTVAINSESLPGDGDAMMQELMTIYEPSEISSSDYPWLESDIETISVRMVLVAVDFSNVRTDYYRLRCEQLRTLGTSVRAAVAERNKTMLAPWANIDLDASVGDWQRDSCSTNDGNSVKVSQTTNKYPIEGLKACLLKGQCE